ncbi:hypothetical protein [Streptomyces violarus]|uniref:Uncharacterized protein n=1 Tax=Streptomyces violarus TaxID=67380 RepID=A0A7W4ZSD4_9ACTN|nr:MULTISPECIES: hypothetical protein [Streptomyces]MBB3077697.1 hypothetical protein [Streptomyces violarus]WRU00117.1 hypothetical protein VJ737_21510 [Streptomyces sp. CGMCC 4.1772]
MPLDRSTGHRPETDEIDFWFVPGPKLAKALIDAVGEHAPPRLRLDRPGRCRFRPSSCG